MLRKSAGCLLLLSVLPAYGRVAVTAATTILIDTGEPAPLQKAASDLADDFQRVFGQRAKIVHNPAQTGASVIWIALEKNVPKQVTRPTGWEFLHIQAGPAPPRDRRPRTASRSPVRTCAERSSRYISFRNSF